MKTKIRAGALTFGAVIFWALVQHLPSKAHKYVSMRRPPRSSTTYHHKKILALSSSKSAREESPLARACKSGTSKACNELGDRLVLKHAHAEARQWYVTSCERVRGAMVPTATRLLQLGQDLHQLESPRSDDEYANAASQKRMETLKSDASEIRARLRGCLGTGETMKVDGELKQSLKYYDTVCEFSVLVEAAGEALLDLEHMTENGCKASQAGRAELPGQTPFRPRLFADLVQQQRQPTAARQSTARPEEGMTFGEEDL